MLELLRLSTLSSASVPPLHKDCSLLPTIHGPDVFIAKSPLTVAGLNLELLYIYSCVIFNVGLEK